MEKEVSENNKEEKSLDPSSTNMFKKLNDEDSSDEDESFKSCADPLSLLSRDGNQKPEVEENEEQEVIVRNCPPDQSDESRESFSENGSDDIYYSEIENNENDSDISNPGQENVSANPGEIEISFQRELLDYLGSFFNAESRFRFRDSRQSVNVSEEQLSEYGRLRIKVNKNLKVMGVGNNKDSASSEQNIARNLYYLLAARERGDWTSCRRYSRVVPMWSFEKHEMISIEKPGSEEAMELYEDSKMDDNNSPENTNQNEYGKDCPQTSPIDEFSQLIEDDSMKSSGKLTFKNLQPVKYLRDECSSSNNKNKKNMPNVPDNPEDKVLQLKEEKEETVDMVSCERVQRNGMWDIKSAVYGSRWSVRRLGLESRFNAHDGCVNALDFSSSGNWIASGSDDRYIVITDWQQKHQLSRFKVGHSNNIFQVRFLPGSNDLELVSCSRDSTVRYAALSSTGQLQYSRLLARHKDCCHKMDVPIDQPCLVISAGEDTRVMGSDVRAPNTVSKICAVDKVPLYTISCNPVRSQEFAVAGKDSRVFIYDRRKPKEFLRELCPENLSSKPHSSFHVTSVVYSKNGESVLASYNDDDIYLLSTWPRSDGPIALHKYQGHRNVQTVTGVSFYGPQHEYVVSGSNDGHVLIWERDSEALVNWFRADENGVVNVLEPHPIMPILATAGLDHDIKMWSMLAADGEQDRSLPLDQPLLERDIETSRIDYAWKKLDEQIGNYSTDDHSNIVPFNLRNLKVITALNWKMRDESYPFSIDNNLDNLIFMSRRNRGENQFRGIFVSDSDSADSFDSASDLYDNVSAPGSSERNAGNSTGNTTQSNRGDSGDANRPDGCRSS